ncbi:MAG: DUF11 domain-containing protein [Gammaproteobacteria bacterium]|nr:DUF11 domain-containing protein [Gammaproteobacteria bacterium]
MFPPRRIRRIGKYRLTATFGILSGLLFAQLATAAAPPGAVISNEASVNFLNNGGQAATVVSNEVQLVTAVERTAADLELTRVVPTGSGSYLEPVGPASCLQGGTFAALADPVLSGGQAVDPAASQDVAASRNYNLGEPLFLRLSDADQNVDYQVVDVAEVTVEHPSSGDIETIQLSETGPDTGVFVGYVPSAPGAVVPGDCVLQGSPDTEINASYTDPADATDSAATAAKLDPVSIVFDSQTGAIIDGATIELVDTATGLPAVVYGNDGVSSYPAQVVSGSSVTDGSGNVYTLGPGEFRFPNVAAGTYQLNVQPPENYLAPSTVTTANLQLLPGAPFDLVDASFGGSFATVDAAPFEIDIPLDPVASTLFLQKSTITATAAPGDFVRFDLSIENNSPTVEAIDVNITDQLPAGMRFVDGSVTRDGAVDADPVLSSDGSQLEFALGDMAAGEQIAMSYVVEIVAGSTDDELINTAVASATGGLVSNESAASVLLREDLFRSTSTLIGRVVNGQCTDDGFSDDQGVAGVRVYLEDGRYAITDESGRYHFEGLKPGGHVAQLDPQSIPGYFDVAECETATRFAGRSDSQFVELTRGSLTRADFYLSRKEAPEGKINIELVNRSTGKMDEVEYLVTMNGVGNIDISNVQLMVMLPDGIRYRPDTVDGGDLSIGEPRISGSALTFALPDQSADWTRRIRFTGAIDALTTGELRTRALLRFDSPIERNQKTPVAESAMLRQPARFDNEGYVLNLQFDVLSATLSAADRAELDRLIADWRGVTDVRIDAVGHSDSQRIAPRNRHIFADNFLLSEARARSAATYIADALHVQPSEMQVEGRGPNDPLADNATAAGRQQNRRVEIILSGRRPAQQSFLKVAQASSGTLIAETRGVRPGTVELQAQMLSEQRLADHLTPDKQVQPHINSHRPGIAWVMPSEDFRPAVPAIKIAVKHALDQTVMLFVNGATANPLNFDGIEVNSQQTLAVSRWAGVDLVEGSNQVTAEVIDENGRIVERLMRSVHYAGQAVRGELLEESSILVADGRTRPVVAVRLFDRFGEPARQTSVGAFYVNSPYRSWWEVDNGNENQLVTIGSREPLYTIGKNGVALIELEPTTESGTVRLNLKFDNKREQTIDAWVKPQPRDWILVGFGEGTVGYNTLSHNLDPALAAGQDEGLYEDGRLAFFAKGRIKGEFLLTLAYDSARKKSRARQQFQTEVNPQEYYPLFADNTEQRFEAPSQSKLYVKLERNQFVALFGDYDTGLSVTELSRYERRFNGLKSEYDGRHFAYTAFASETDQSFVRDEIRGDGTSGLYQLSTRPIIGMSEQIRIEVRDRFDTGVVLSARPLSRFLDYNLDIFDGTLFFKSPVPSRDENFNPIYIVAEYETRGGTGEDTIAGGRAAIKTGNRNIEVGLTHIDDSQQGSESELTGIDLRWQATNSTVVRAEIARSESLDGVAAESGTAELLSIEHQSDRLDLRAYYRSIDDGFGLGSQSGAESGISRIGLDGRLKLNAELQLNAQANVQENLESGAERAVAEADVTWQTESSSATAGLVHATDEFTDGEKLSSTVAQVGVSKRMFDSALTVRANGSTQLGGDAQNGDYPTSYVLGADYEAFTGVSLFGELEQAEGRDIEASMARVGVRATPWSRAQFNSSVTNQVSEFGPRLFANVGLSQGFQLNDRWAVDIGIDKVETLSDTDLRRFDEERELAFGSLTEDFTAASVGAMYQSEFWAANSRLEFRDSDVEQRMSLLFGWYREPRAGHGLSAGLSVLHGDQDNGARSLTADLRLGWAYRPAGSRWSFLNRTDFIFEDVSLLDDQRLTWRLINNFNANRRISEHSQLSLQYAAKYVRSEFGTAAFTGYTDLLGIDYRRGFGKRWDAGVNSSVYHSYRSGVIDYGLGVDVGLNVRDNVWLTLGYNALGFHDVDFADARYTAHGPYLRISIKADQHTLKSIAGQTRH